MISLTQLKFLPIRIGPIILKNLFTQLLTFLLIFSGTHSYAAKIKVGAVYEGGTVFCVSDTADTSKCVTEGAGEYGLIMANEDQANFDSNPEHGVSWATDYDLIPDAQSDDDGIVNTAAIIKRFPNDNPSNNAAWACNKYKDPSEGYTDWYLPAKNELNKMYLFARANNLIGKSCSGNKFNGVVQCLVGGYSDEDKDYWSSSECSGDAFCGAWSQGFGGGYQSNDNLTYGHFAVRAVRAFNNLEIQQFNMVEVKSLGDSVKEGVGLKSLSNSSIGFASQRMQESITQEGTESASIFWW